MRPVLATGSSSASSIAVSVSSESLKPSPPKNLMPLSRYGLWEAEMTTPRSSPWRPSSSGAPGGGSTPPSSASPPAAAMPAATAASSISPDSRVSRITSTRAGSRCCTRVVAARASGSASSALKNSPATPRTPSVPKSLRVAAGAAFTSARSLALAELRPLTGLLQPGLLALLHARVARQEAAALELGPQVGIGFDERTGDPVAQRAGLGGDAAAVHPGHDVHAAFV